jgi:hypothetical protein
LRGTAFVRQRATGEASPFGDPGNQVQVAGHTWGITGPPDRITPPGSAIEHHVEVSLRYVEG